MIPAAQIARLRVLCDAIESETNYVTKELMQDSLGNNPALVRELLDAYAALVELVECKELKEAGTELIRRGSDERHPDLVRAGAEYHRRQPLAWAAARRIVRGEWG